MFKFIIRKLREQTGTSSVSKSVDYQAHDVGKMPPPSYRGGRIVPIYFEHTVGAGTYTTGTTDTTSGTVVLFTHPKGWKFIGLRVSTNGLSASAGVGQSPVIGDGTTANKYMLASDFDVTQAIGLVNGASYGYTPTADMPVTLTYGATGTPVPGAVIMGVFEFIPGS